MIHMELTVAAVLPVVEDRPSRVGCRELSRANVFFSKGGVHDKQDTLFHISARRYGTHTCCLSVLLSVFPCVSLLHWWSAHVPVVPLVFSRSTHVFLVPCVV